MLFLIIIFSNLITTKLYAINILLCQDAETQVSTEITLMIDIQNDDEFVAFQIDMELPRGLNYVVNSTELTNRAQDHFLQVSCIEDNILRLISFSMSILPFIGNSGTVVELDFNVNLEEGTYPILLSNGVLSNANSENILDILINGQLTVTESSHIESELINPGITDSQISPNPFLERTQITFNLIKKSKIEIYVYNIKGEAINTIHTGELKKGIHIFAWDGIDYKKKSVSSGIYFFRIQTDGYFQALKTILMK